MPSTSAETTLIVGSGAMGCLFAARLSAAGYPVVILGSWPAGVEALVKHGVTLVEPDGRQQAYPVQVATDTSACMGARFALVLVKAWQTGRAARQLEHCLAADGLALSLQNGMGNREKLVRRLGAARVALGATTAGATLLAAGVVRPAGDGGQSAAPITLGAHARIEPLAERLRAAGFAVHTTADLKALLWGKLVINAAINPLTALLHVTNGELLARPSARALLAAAAGEAALVAAAQGVTLPYPDAVAAAESVARNTASNRSSMLQDVERGAPTEIDAINGAVVRAGKARRLPTPIHHVLWQLVKGIEEATKNKRTK